MNVYRITFHSTKFFNTQHYDTTADTANHYHILKQNRKIGEESKLWKAIKVILDDTGENKELVNLMEKAYLLRKPDPYYQCVGIYFDDRHGVKIEMRFNENISN